MSSVWDDVRARLHPSREQWDTIIVAIVYFVVIALLWMIPYVKQVLFPFKVITVAIHEFGHASVGVCTGAKIEGIEVNPDQGGVTHMRGGNQSLVLPAGYLGSSFFGALMIFAGFNVVAAKVAAVILGVMMIITLFWSRNWFARIITVLCIGAIVLFWFVFDGFLLRYFVLFFGVMSGMYSVWDICDDLIFRKVNESDATKFSKQCCGGCCSPQVWGVVWFLVALLFMVAGVVAGLLAFKDDGEVEGAGFNRRALRAW